MDYFLELFPDPMDFLPEPMELTPPQEQGSGEQRRLTSPIKIFDCCSSVKLAKGKKANKTAVITTFGKRDISSEPSQNAAYYEEDKSSHGDGTWMDLGNVFNCSQPPNVAEESKMKAIQHLKCSKKSQVEAPSSGKWNNESPSRDVMNNQDATNGSRTYPVDNGNNTVVVTADRKRPRKQQRKVVVDSTLEKSSDLDAVAHTCACAANRKKYLEKKDESLDETLSHIFDDDWRDIPCDCFCVKCLFS